MPRVIKAEVDRARRIGLMPMLIAALVVALMGSAVYLTVASAVHVDGVFQLDGNARTNQFTPPLSGEDWDLICKAHQPTSVPAGTCVFTTGYLAAQVPALGNTSSIDHQFVTELDPDSILTGGGT